MKSIIEKQIELQTGRYIEKSQRAGNDIYFHDLIDRIVGTRSVLEKRRTLFPANHITKYKQVDLDDHNENIMAISDDLKIIFELLNEIKDKSLSLVRVNGDFANFNISTLTRLGREIDILRANTISRSHTYIETFKDNGNITDSSSVVLNTRTRNVHLVSSDLTRPLIPEEANVTVSIDSEHRYKRLEITGSKLNMLPRDIIDWNRGKEIIYSVIHGEREQLQLNISIEPLRDIKVNIITIYPDMPEPTPGTVTIYKKDSDDPFIKNDYIMTNNVIRLQFSDIMIDRVEINVYKSNETRKSEDEFMYDFVFNGIELENRKYVQSGYINSKALSVSINNETTAYTKLSMFVNDNVSEGTYIDYFLSNDGSSWRPIIPMNKSKDTRNIIDFTSSSDNIIEEITSTAEDTWSKLTPIRTFGEVPLYNIIENIQDTLVEEGKIDTIDEIIQDSVQLERGFGDYSVTYEDGSVTTEVQDSVHVFESTIDKINLSISITEDKFVGSDYSVETNYPVEFQDFVTPEITIKIGTRIHDCGAYFDNGILYISTDSAANIGDLVTVKYMASLKEIEETDDVIIDVDRFSIRAKTVPGDNVSYIDSNNYYFNSYDKFIRLSRTSTIPTDSSGDNTRTIYISMRYITRRKDKYRVFKTYLVNKTEVKLPIFPFVDEEILAGNYHEIDGNLISKNTEYVIGPGVHEIKTTQAHKTDPDGLLDVNDLTKTYSNAGIDLSSMDPNSYKGFSEPMRRVNAKKLSRIISPLDHRTFAIDDHRIIINFIPEEIHGLLNMTPHISGTELLNKRAIYDTDAESTFLSYDHIPEKFRLSFKTKQNITDLKKFYYRVEFSRDENINNISPEVSKLSINLI